MAHRQVCLLVGLLCLVCGCRKKDRDWVVVQEVEIGPVSPFWLAYPFDLCLTSDGAVVVPYIHIWGVPRPDTRRLTKYTARVALLPKNGKLKYFDITHAVERQNEGDLACSCTIDENDHGILLFGLGKRFTATEFDVRSGKVVLGARSRELPVPEGVVLQAAVAGKGKSHVALIVTNSRVEGKWTNVLTAYALNDELAPLDVPYEGWRVAWAMSQAEIWVAAFVAHADTYYTVRLSKLCPDNGAWTVKPSGLPDLILARRPGRGRRELELVFQEGRPLLLAASGGATYEFRFDRTKWQTLPVSIGPDHSAAVFRSSVCVACIPFGPGRKLFFKDKTSGDWQEWDVEYAFPKWVYQSRLLGSPDGFLYTLTSENEKKEDPPRLVLRKWRFRKSEARE